MSDVDYIQKGTKTVNNQYTFASHDAVVSKLHPYLVKWRLAVIPTVLEMVQDGNRTMGKIAVAFVNIDRPEDIVCVNFCGYGIDGGEKGPGDKGPGKATSYAVKYALLKTFCLETGDDPDNDAKVVYEPAKCLEFAVQVPQSKDMDKFVEYSAKVTEKHVEDIKREAMKRLPDFMAAFEKWNKKKKETTV